MKYSLINKDFITKFERIPAKIGIKDILVTIGFVGSFTIASVVIWITLGLFFGIL